MTKRVTPQSASQGRQDMVENWLWGEVAPAYDRHKANPGETKPLAEAASRVQHHMDSAAKKVR
jgi:antitoxin ParD1/3/4